MHHDDPERLASYADVLAGELPGDWRSTHHPPDRTGDLAELADRIWDMDLVAESLAQHPLRHAAVLTREDGAQLVVLDRDTELGGYLIAAIAPTSVPDEAYRGVPEPNGLALADDPFQGAEQVACDLLARYNTALAQVGHRAGNGIVPSKPERVVVNWRADGSLTAAPDTEEAATVLAAHGFVRAEGTDTYVLGDDTTDQAEALQDAGSHLASRGIGLALHSPSPWPTPAVTAPAPATREAPSMPRRR